MILILYFSVISVCNIIIGTYILLLTHELPNGIETSLPNNFTVCCGPKPIEISGGIATTLPWLISFNAFLNINGYGTP